MGSGLFGGIGGVAGALGGTGGQAREVDEADYVVVGSGPGGAPVAARLAEAGFSVVVLEAGPPEGDKIFYDVPAFSGYAAASDTMVRWDHYVRHYTDAELGEASSQWVTGRGVLYPRASTLGGCTAHHGMITMYPEHADWAYVQRLTGDDSWAPERMWEHWERGVLGWQPVEFPPLEFLELDGQLAALFKAAAAEARGLPGGDVVDDVRGVNKRPNVDASAQGFFYTPQATQGGRRVGPRERLLAVARAHPGRLTIVCDALAERVVLETAPDGRQRAVAVEYLKGRHLYGASPKHRALSDAERAQARRSVRARREVIVAGGAFASPQLLMLSGIGPREHLARHGVPVKIHLPGVGGNLQDRYEVSVVTDHPPFFATAPCTFGKGLADPCLAAWQAGTLVGLGRYGYGSNGIIGGVKRRYGSDRRAELFVFGSLADFRGYVPGFDRGYGHERFSWLVLKGHSRSRAGTVRLAAADPTVPPLINKANFDDGAGGAEDLAALAEGVRTIRRINAAAGKGTEVWPGPEVDGDRLEPWIRQEAWGHHASCTNPIGPADDPRSVLDGRFTVHGTANLRVVDASAFPRIPGLFIWAPVAIAAEKAAADILAAAGARAAH
ncbi:MAG TPA: GMC family oxidoreductase [Thermomonospora sp.]|nr:GMC family oxidoreductase [Thermomonospora sp.]